MQRKYFSSKKIELVNRILTRNVVSMYYVSVARFLLSFERKSALLRKLNLVAHWLIARQATLNLSLQPGSINASFGVALSNDLLEVRNFNLSYTQLARYRLSTFLNGDLDTQRVSCKTSLARFDLRN